MQIYLESEVWFNRSKETAKKPHYMSITYSIIEESKGPGPLGRDKLEVVRGVRGKWWEG